MNDSLVRIERQGATAVVTLDHPASRNALCAIFENFGKAIASETAPYSSPPRKSPRAAS